MSAFWPSIQACIAVWLLHIYLKHFDPDYWRSVVEMEVDLGASPERARIRAGWWMLLALVGALGNAVSAVIS